MLTLLLSLFFLDPVTVSRLVAPELEAVCWRESKCTRVGVHEGDAWMARTVWRNAVRVGWLQPEWCPWHRSPEGMGSRGAFGLAAGYSLHHVAPCLPAWVLDVPLVSAIAAKRRAESEACGRHSRCVSWRGDA